MIYDLATINRVAMAIVAKLGLNTAIGEAERDVARAALAAITKPPTPTKNSEYFKVQCPYCLARPGAGCRYIAHDGSYRSISPHRARVRSCEELQQS
ncbi:zinc finger domain-containing protein [Bradyrhizobium genosp. L]|uniref:zinc finger domain-containing protein n=1 Tax=Bradyrhizobium genosp. L TaxID=83637 RepID=UPI003D9AD0DB